MEGKQVLMNSPAPNSHIWHFYAERTLKLPQDEEGIISYL